MPSDPVQRLLADPPDLPVVDGLVALTVALRAHGVAVLQAPPGTGKTTLVPPAVSALVGGRVVVTQPRRIAARAAAHRLAQLLGEPVGRTAGYVVRGERRTAPSTRVEFVTTGILLRRLQRDPALPGVAAVVLDEVHERQLEADLALAMLVDVRSLRDLPLVAMSATVEAGRTAAVLGGAPVIEVRGSLHPVRETWSAPPPGVRRMDDRGVTPAFLDHLAAVTRSALAEERGDVLVFLPGVAEIAATVRRLAGVDADVRPLHGRLTHRDQDLALTEGDRRRVVVSTSVAESSLTVPGVRTVVDAGLTRRPHTDHRRGLAGLVTVAVSRAAAEQRAGRAGREGPGVVHRCWTRAEHAHLDAHPEPEIATADLTALALELAVWGSALVLLDPPPEAAMTAARSTLRDLGAVDEDGSVTARGRLMADVGADPRLARALLDGAEIVGAHRAAEVVALLAEDVRAPGGDLVAALRAVRRGGPDSAAWAAAARQLESSVSPKSQVTGPADDLAVGLVVALAHPDRVARRRPGGTSHLMVSGTGAVLADGSPLATQSWLAVGDAERRPGHRDATIRSAAPLDEDSAIEAASRRWVEEDRVEWSGGRVLARRLTRLGAIELTSMTLEDPPASLVAAAVREGLRVEGLTVLPWTDAAMALRARIAFLHRAIGDPWPDVSDGALTGAVDSSEGSFWLGPELARIRGTRDLRRVDVLTALRRLLPWPQAARLDELAPERVRVPSGAMVRVDYGADQPVLAVRIQEAFGWRSTPRLADGRVPLLLHLLTPARRPAAVTADLESFWATGYPQVRAELRGRYPKHAWPEDPWTAPATRGTGRPRG